jgi:hypothetical protein
MCKNALTRIEPLRAELVLLPDFSAVEARPVAKNAFVLSVRKGRRKVKCGAAIGKSAQ